MDYDKKQETSPFTVVVITMIMIGIFSYLGYSTAAYSESPLLQQAQGYYVVDALANVNREHEEQMVSWLIDIIQGLIAENKDLREQLHTGQYHVSFDQKPHVLLAVGHTAATRGAQYGSTIEYDLNYQLVGLTRELLEQMGYTVTVTHQGDNYSQEFLNYFSTHESEIDRFLNNHRDAYALEYPRGVVTNDTDHNVASPRATIQLFGINHWANENAVDAVVHVHFNDYPGRPAGQRGIHTGFSVFVPLKTNDNFIESFRLAKSVEQEMLQYTNRSTVLQESAGVLESELIAVGQAGSVDAPAILIEGGFIYEEKFTDQERRSVEFANYAQAISQAVDRYFYPIRE